MDRREAISRVALIMGGSLIGAEYFFSGCKSTTTEVGDLFDAAHIAFLNEVADTILPTTSSPGAKAANVGHFMAVMVRDCYSAPDQKIFLKGFKQIDDASMKQFNKKKFLELTPDQRNTMLSLIDTEQRDFTLQKNKKLEADMLQYKDDPTHKAPEIPNHYFRMMKELTLLGYFTSEIGATKALRYIAVPGHYDGALPYKKGDKAWAT